MTITFTIPYAFLRDILAELRRHPYHVAIGQAGMSTLPTGVVDILVRSFRFVHEGALRREQEHNTLGFELGFVPYTLNRPQVWQAVALAATIGGDLPAQPTCSILLGSGQDAGRFTGICSVSGQIMPVQTMRVVGPGMHRLAAVDFRTLHPHAISPDDAERWSRVIGALGGSEVWQRFRSLHVCIVGLGRTGSLVATTLTKQGARHLSFIDPDVLDLYNLDSMDAVTIQNLGQRKAQAVAENLQHDFPYAHIAAAATRVTTAEARCLLKSADILIACVDNDAARLLTGALACRYSKPLLDVGTGIFYEPPPMSAVPPPALSAHPHARHRRALGADVRLILPGDGCLLCLGGVANPQEALQRWRTDPPPRPWQAERAGSLRSLNAIATHLGIRCLEDLVAGRLTHSVWHRFEMDETGMPTLRHLPARRRPGCALCQCQGRGDSTAQARTA